MPPCPGERRGCPQLSPPWARAPATCPSFTLVPRRGSAWEVPKVKAGAAPAPWPSAPPESTRGVVWPCRAAQALPSHRLRAWPGVLGLVKFLAVQGDRVPARVPAWFGGHALCSCHLDKGFSAGSPCSPRAPSPCFAWCVVSRVGLDRGQGCPPWGLLDLRVCPSRVAGFRWLL